MNLTKVKTRRGGVTIIESMMALAVLTTVITFVAQTLIGVGRQQIAGQRRQMATLEAANVMERISAIAWSELTTAKLANWNMSESARHALPDGELNVRIDLGKGLPRRKRIRIEITWQEGGVRVAPVSLVAWKHLTKEAD